DRSLALDDAAGASSLTIGSNRFATDVHTFDSDAPGPCQNLKHASSLALVTTRENYYLLVLFDLHPGCHRYITSGARLTIFIKPRSRSSRATGPKTRVPTGSPSGLIRTAAF